MHTKINEKEILKMLAENKLTNSENNLQRIPYDFVLQLLDKIRNGSYREISFLDFNVIEKQNFYSRCLSSKNLDPIGNG